LVLSFNIVVVVVVVVVLVVVVVVVAVAVAVVKTNAVIIGDTIDRDFVNINFKRPQVER
jgi:hypothetical protein